MANVFFHSADRSFKFKNKSHLKNIISELFNQEHTLLKRLDYIFCSDEYLLDLNQRSLQHDYYTDILTFPLSDEGTPVVAEIYISLDRVKDNSRLHDTSFENEILRVIFHGALHLCGCNDHSKNEKYVMRRKEDYYITMFHVKQNELK